jgi:ornithine cyclodeaminase
MLLVGAGRVGWELVPAHCSVRPIETIWVHDQFEPAAENLVTHLLAHGYKAQVCPDTTLADVAGKVDLISCATLAESSVILGNWVRPGTHIDLVGSFTPTMREVDDCLMQQAEIYVDFREQALAESGELILPISTGAISTKDIVADLPQLCRGEVLLPLENDYQAKRITVFKAVGDAREDLATAILLHQISSSSQ